MKAKMTKEQNKNNNNNNNNQDYCELAGFVNNADY